MDARVATAAPASVATGLLFEPVTRVAGALALHVDADMTRGRYAAARCAAQAFRGYESILQGRDYRDAIFTSSRCCGYHGGQHAVAAAQAVEMALGVTPPPLAVAVRNLGLAAETIHAEAAHLVLLVGPDLCEESVRARWPDVWAAAERSEAPSAAVHGMGTIGEIMYSLNPFTGQWYREALNVARVPFSMYAILQGKYPHPEAIVPGGVATTITTTKVHDYLVRLLSLVDPAKRVGTLLLDLLDWLVGEVPALAEVGVRPANLFDTGQWDVADGYDPTWSGLTERGRSRWAAPGVLIDGQLVTDDLREIVDGIEEQVDRSFYKPTEGVDLFTQRMSPAPGPTDWAGRYSWCASARWRGHALETGPGARLWMTVLRGHIHDNPFITVQDGGIQLDLPAAALPRIVLEWRPPAAWNAIERNRARLYSIVFAALVAANNVLTILNLQKAGLTAVSVPAVKPTGERRGVGLAGDGVLGHWLVLDRVRIDNYQVVAPSTFNLGPGGPAEEAIDATPIVGDRPNGAEALIALRSFDPCVNCATH